MTPPIPQSVVVLGAGPAGLTAAYRLAHCGLRVTLVDQSPVLGEHLGRERDPPFAILGCHHATWSLLRSLGVRSASPTFVEAALEFLLPGGQLARYPQTRFPPPLHQLLAIGRFTGLSWGERWRLLSWLEQVWEGSFSLTTDLELRTARDWLVSIGQSDTIVETVWNPLARWLTGNDVRRLSADAFIASLKPFFLSKAADGRICVPTQPWHRIFVQPISDSLTKYDATLLLRTRALQFLYEQDRIIGLRMQDGTILRSDWYVAAVPHHQLTPLLPERWLTRFAYFQQISELTMLPCTVIQAHTAQTITTPRHIVMSSGPFPWVACAPSKSGENLVTVLTISPEQSAADAEQLVSNLLRSLGLLQPDGQLGGFYQQEIPHAVLALSPGTKVQRPIQRSPVPNLLLAGAWTDTGWPANLESAILSGERCAEIIIGSKPA